MNNQKYSYSFNGENYTGHFDSIDEALRVAALESELDENEAAGCWIGENTKPPMPWQLIAPDLITDHIDCREEYSMEYAETWCQIKKGRTEEMIEESLSEYIKQWYEENYEPVTFFIVENVEYHQFPDAGEE